ncbi:amino-acid N-acetyltransferase [Sediminivirga luteola]|uniref:amino-acid N-acetyltransferase n=1 Tax=Sediminivirga luteola TaxID=1774748 RepID=UPI003BB7EDF9
MGETTRPAGPQGVSPAARSAAAGRPPKVRDADKTKLAGADGRIADEDSGEKAQPEDSSEGSSGADSGDEADDEDDSGSWPAGRGHHVVTPLHRGGGATGGAGSRVTAPASAGRAGHAPPAAATEQPVTVRKAVVADIPRIFDLVAPMAESRLLVAKEKVAYYESVQEFRVAEVTGADGAPVLAGCAALHVMWSDLAEARTVATHPQYRGLGIGKALMEQLFADARELGVKRIFCLTFETEFFSRLGFEEIEGTPVEPEVYMQLLRSHDEGVAEFLDLARVKPNTLGNSRMLKYL